MCLTRFHLQARSIRGYTKKGFGIQLSQLDLFAFGRLEIGDADADEPDLSSVLLEFAKEQDDVISDNAQIINIASMGFITSESREPLKPNFDTHGTVEKTLAEKSIMDLEAQ